MFTGCIARKGAFLLLLTMGFLMAAAQDMDSVQFVKAAWKKERLGAGVQLYTRQFTDKALFASNQFIVYAVIKNRGRKKRFHIAAEKKMLKPVSVFAREANAIVAVNGNFFNTKDGGSVDYVKTDGRLISENLVGGGGKLSAHQRSAIAIKRGKLSIVAGNDKADWPDAIAASSVMANGPLLTLDAVDQVMDASAFSRNRHPRTAVGLTKRGKVILLVADGRYTNAAGLSLGELQKIMRWLNCSSAINFDGGGSSTLWTRKRGVVNHPSDNKKWDHEGERPVANVLYYSK
ncbi:phosphodiester glycosidase family protein [Niabella sp. CC-SYL272]|uniref:phosphodiester glycosidase family protein n=1 Tax=Niabella agricola TaxID=2891571 RepID=UPI001F2A26A5|nr:phosphodiester glycosidase family protein [Niabella agricola]MCF3111874.1 phosphodiester glycosidase family protein [Niabella agricola]